MIRLLVLGIAVAAGAGAGLLGWRALSAPEPAAPSQIARPALVDVLIVARDIAAGESLDAGDVIWRPWPVEAVAEIHLIRSERPDAAEEMTGTLARTRLVAGEPVLEAKLSGAGQNLLATLLRAGERAIAVRISAENTAGGFILPGDRVDVLHTRVGGSGRQGESAAILRNVEVLAIDQTADEDTQGALIGRTATLRVTSVQAERLVAAEATGKLSLALRAAADVATIEPDPATPATPEPSLDEAAGSEAGLRIRVRRGLALETIVLQ